MEQGKGDWQEKRVLITGSTGFLGCWLSNSLAEKGAKITGIDISQKPSPSFRLFNLKEKINQLNVDLKDIEKLKDLFKDNNPEIILHLAAQPLVTEANKNPIPTFENNIKGTWNILEVARKTDTPIIIASSDKAYGTHKNLPYTEEMPLKGSFPYDVSKTAKDLIAQAYYKTYGLPLAITRFANFYGGGDLHFDRIVPGTIRSLTYNESPIIRSNGKYIRDYIYIKDVVSAYILLAENLEKHKGEAFNFSNEDPIDVLSIVSKITSLMNKSHEPKILDEAKGEIVNQYLSGKKARELLGWQPKYNLDQGLKETIEWYKNYFG